MVDVSIIIVSWNVREYLARCLESIALVAGDISLEVFVVDNGSTDGTADFVRDFRFQISDFRFIANQKNLGFAAANNQAMQQAKGKYILLLNPDTEIVSPDFFPRLFDLMEWNPFIGIVGPKLLNPDGTVQPSVRRFPDAFSPILISLGLHWKPARRYLAEDFDYTKGGYVQQVMGACFFMRREVMEEVGLFDERFFIWFEEVDYCKRTIDHESGWEIFCLTDIVVVHHGGESFRQVMTLKKQWMYIKSLLYYFRKHQQYGAWVVNALSLPFRLLLSLLRN